MKGSAIWITWENQIRNISMSNRLGALYCPIVYKGNFFIRYLFCSCKTVYFLFLNRGGYVFVQNPSIVLAFIGVIFRPFFKYTLIVDAHNSGVFPARKLQGISNFINRNASFVIVTNEGLGRFIKSVGGNPIILPDPLPEITIDPNIKSVFDAIPTDSTAVMVICSWASDEPYLEILSAAEKLPNVRFYITGNSKGRESRYSKAIPSNVVLTGYIPTNDYHVLLMNCSLILDLTTREDCLVCGAYEAISVGKPLILSATQALKSYFGDEALFVQNESNSITQGVSDILSSYEKHAQLAKTGSQRIEARWQLLLDQFKRAVYGEQG